MKNIKVEVTRLKETLIRNRDQHRQHYQKAVAGWRKECMEIAAQMIESLEKGRVPAVGFLPDAPMDMTESYNTVIEMCNWTLDSQMELTEQEVMMYIQDKWAWKNTWTTSNSKYMTP